MLDTGSELTTISRQTASSAVVRPITYTLSAGVGEVGLRGLQLGRLDTLEIGTLKLSNVPTLIKAPALRGIPKRETESFSPLGARPVDDHRLRDAQAVDRRASCRRSVRSSRCRCGTTACRWSAAC